MIGVVLMLEGFLTSSALAFSTKNVGIHSFGKDLLFRKKNKNCLKGKDLFTSLFVASTSNRNVELFSEIVNNDLAPAYGGDFAGHSATYNAASGKLIPVPEHLIPESMIEWGDIPGCLEIITSEDAKQSEKESNLSMDRFTVSILPEVGCGVDNLDTTLQRSTVNIKGDFSSFLFKQKDNETSDEIGVSSFHHDVYTGASSSNTHKCKIMLETTFHYIEDNSEDDDYGNKIMRRIRVEMDIVIDTSRDKEQRCQFLGPIRVFHERKTSNVSTNGEIAKGGGLDGRTVTRLIGGKQANKPFTDQIDTILNNRSLIVSPERFFFREDEEQILDNEFCDAEKSVHFQLPLGLTVQYEYNDSSDLIKLLISKTSSESAGGNWKRVVCARIIKLSGKEVEIKSKHWGEKPLQS